MNKKEEQKATVNQKRFMSKTFYGHQLPATSSIEDGQQKAGEKVTPQTKENDNNSINNAEGQPQFTLSAEERELLAYMPKTSALLQQVLLKSERGLAEEVTADANVKLVELEEVLFWPKLTDREIQFVECVKPWLKEIPGGRKDLQLSTRQLVNVFRWLGCNGFSQRTIQRHLRSLWEKGVVTNRMFKSFDLQRYVALYYSSKVFTPLMRVFEPLAPVVQDKERQRQAEQEEWERRKQLAMGLLNCYLVPWDVKVVDKEGRFDD